MSNWISVEDRLPEVGTMVLAWSKTNDDYEFAWIEKDGSWDLAHSGWASPASITHWMSLPEPPKE